MSSVTSQQLQPPHNSDDEIPTDDRDPNVPPTEEELTEIRGRLEKAFDTGDVDTLRRYASIDGISSPPDDWHLCRLEDLLTSSRLNSDQAIACWNVIRDAWPQPIQKWLPHLVSETASGGSRGGDSTVILEELIDKLRQELSANRDGFVLDLRNALAKTPSNRPKQREVIERAIAAAMA